MCFCIDILENENTFFKADIEICLFLNIVIYSFDE